MAILANKQTRVVVQGLTGAAGTFHAKQMRDYGTAGVAGMTRALARELAALA